MLPNDANDQALRLVLQKVTDGRLTLFLGAGINHGSKNSQGEDAPLGNSLGVMIREHFFPDDEHLPTDLPTISRLVEVRENRRVLEHYIHEVLIDYQPSATLKKIPQFRWRNIFTTNFDLLIETAYESVPTRKQKLRPIYSSFDLMDFDAKDEIPYYKLHGCISQISSREIPLILTIGDYSLYRSNQPRLFERLSDTLHDNTVLFIGYRLADPNFQTIFHEVQQAMGGLQNFPRCYAIMVDPSPVDVELWNAQKVTIFNMTAAHFFELANEQQMVKPAAGPQDAVLVADSDLRIDIHVAGELFKCFDLVDEQLGYDGEPNFPDFYQGNKPSWEVIRCGGDSKRTLYDEIIENVLFVEEAEKVGLFEMVVITAEAGGGKTTLLMRLAHDHAILLGGFCLYHKSFKDISISVLEEVHRVVKRRIFVFVDDAADNIRALSTLARSANVMKIPCTVVCAERKNEWNSIKEQLSSVVPLEYEIEFLDDQEIESVLEKLEQHEYLCDLQTRTQEERRAVFKQKAHKQMLVAMREATEGKDFDKIIQDEYDNIPSDLGRRMYLYICALHRFGVPVRVGLMKRLSGVSFSEFRERLFEPLERVVTEEYDDDLDIVTYRSRHPHIAQVVCKYALTNENMLSIYLEIMEKVDLGYSSDLTSFRELIRAREIVDELPNIEVKRLFYNRALLVSGGDPIVYQHYGLMEMRNGNLDEAEHLLSTACQLDPRNHAYRHSYASLLFRKSQEAPNEIQAEKLFKRSQELLSDLIRWNPRNDYAYSRYAENLLGKAKTLQQPLKNEYLQEAHETVLRGLRNCVDKAYLYAVQAQIYEQLGQADQAEDSLLASHNADPSNIRTALLLGWALYKREEHVRAFEIATESLRYNPNDERLNYLAAQIVRSIRPDDTETRIGFLKKAFDPDYIDADVNFQLAVEYFKSGKYSDADEIFNNFRQLPFYLRANKGDAHRPRQYLMDATGSRRKFVGQIEGLTATRYGYIMPDVLPGHIFFRPSPRVQLRPRTRVSFELAFNYFGPIAQNVTASAVPN